MYFGTKFLKQWNNILSDISHTDPKNSKDFFSPESCNHTT